MLALLGALGHGLVACDGTSGGSSSDVAEALDAATQDVSAWDVATQDGMDDTAAGDADGIPDAGGEVVTADALDDTVPDAANDVPPPEFPRGLPAGDEMGAVGDLVVARAIVHAHSLYSHDACDGQPTLEDGSPNEECLHDLKDAICTNHIDFLFMTEHYGMMAETLDFEELFLHREGDEWIDEDGHHSANAVVCADGHRAMILPGLEGGSNLVSPVGLTRHPVEGDAAAIEAGYKDISPAGLQRMRDADAVLTAIHMEGADRAHLAQMDLDALEIGNLHVLIEPGYREELGLSMEDAVVAFLAYVRQPDRHPAPDLVFMEFHDRMPLYHEIWDEILGTRFVAGFAGNDAHRNVFPSPAGDGERPDSYRRMMKWYVNHLLVPERTPSAARTALRDGHAYIVFELFGSPVGFDFHVEGADGEQVGMGGTLDTGGDASTARIVATVPEALLGDELNSPPVTLELYRVTSEGSQVIAQSDVGIDMEAPGPGRYRLEVSMVPSHLAPYVVGYEQMIRELPWIYSNPITIE